MPENHRDLKARVMEYLDNNRGNRVHLSQMVKDLGETPRRIQGAISNLRLYQNYPVRSIVKGHTWFVEKDEDIAVAVDCKKSYTEVTNLMSGAVLLERSDGELFKAILTRVEI